MFVVILSTSLTNDVRRPLADAGGGGEVAGDDEEALAIEDMHGDPVHIPPAAAIIRPIPLADESIACRAAGLGFPRVHFDNFTHQSGNLRAYIRCGLHKHSCRLYVFVKDHASRRHAAEFLFVWAAAAGRYPSTGVYERDRHAEYRPTAEEAAVMYREQFG